MNKILFGLAALTILLSGCNTKPTFTLKGKLEGDTDKALLVGVVDKEGYHTIDTLTLKDGVVNYTVSLDQPVLMILGLDGSRARNVFFADNVDYTIEGTVTDLKGATVKGGQAFDDYAKIKKLDDEFNVLLQDLRIAYNEASQAGDEAKMKEIDETYDAAFDKNSDDKMAFVTENPSSPVAAYVVYDSYRHQPLEDIKEAIAKLNEAIKASPYYQMISERADKLETVAIGKVAPDFTLNDKEGNPFSLSSLKGKYVLIDFWASWCGPCRRENPNVVKLYNEFKDKGFDILGVSLDEKKDAWEKAIEDDQLTWNHVSDLKGWKNEAAQLYGVSSIPHTVLLDPEGKIIAKNLRGEELHAKISELLK
nr:TlpA disulfide reductase family protein [uncultured Carboxylicivirga sp.]